MLVREAMTMKVEWIAPDTCLKDAARMMRDKAIGCLPIGENDRLIGMITDRDIACRGTADGCDPIRTTARDIMSKGVAWCFDDATLDEAAKLMRTRQIHHLPVLDRDKRMIGMLSLSDLARSALPRSAADASGLRFMRDMFRLTARDTANHHRATATH